MSDVVSPVRVDLGNVDLVEPIGILGDLDVADPGPRIDLALGATTLTLSWGQPHQLGTCAYWVSQARTFIGCNGHALGSSLREEVAACLLGGHGIPAEVGLSAFWSLRDAGVLEPGSTPDAAELRRLLTEPLALPGGRTARYRFANQRADRLADALTFLARRQPPGSPIALREWLLAIPGIGPKTASWIVRNHTNSSAIAIIDVHVRRAGLSAGFFSEAWRLPRDYGLFERSFLGVARLGDVSAASLDACIWGQLHMLGAARAHLLGA